MRAEATAILTAALLFAAAPGPALAAAPGAAGHSHHHDHGAEAEATDLPPAPAGLERRLEDETRASGPGRIAWSTFWKLCWQPVAGARHYEMRMQTSEGATRQPRAIDGTCHRVEVAAGENPVAEGLAKRDLMLAMQAAQAALQVRAVLGDGRRTAWSAEQPVGETGSR